MGERIIRMSAMPAKVGLTRNPIYQRLDKNSPRYDPDFPRPVPLGVSTHAVGFIESEVDAWIAAQIAKRDAKL